MLISLGFSLPSFPTFPTFPNSDGIVRQFDPCRCHRPSNHRRATAARTGSLQKNRLHVPQSGRGESQHGAHHVEVGAGWGVDVLYCVLYSWCGCLFCWVLCCFTVVYSWCYCIAWMCTDDVFVIFNNLNNNFNNNFNNNLHSTLFFPQMRGCETGGHHL